MKISQKTLKITAIAVLFLTTILSGCKDRNVGVEGECPIVVSTNPANLATGVPPNQIISVIFNTDMDPQTINAAAFELKGPTPKQANNNASSNAIVAPVQGSITYNEVTKGMIFTPTTNLPYSTTFTATVNRSVTDVMGNALQEPYVWTFSTSAAPVVSPVIASTDPLNLATNVALNKVISATFDQTMDPATITSASFTLMTGTTPIAGTVSYSGLVATFTPTINLLSNTDYTAKITTAVKNPAGVAIASDYTWTFKTVFTVVISPVIDATDPQDKDTNVALNKVISATFDQAMDPATITGTSFTLIDGTTPVAGTVSYSGLEATFTPTSNLQAGTEYTAKITTAAKNLAGDPLASDSVWTFKTVLASVPPVVASTDPLNLATNVALNKVISATFDQAMDPATITGTSFTLMTGTTPIAGTVSYSGLIATFTPTINLLSDTDYTAKITTAVKNPAGVAIASDYTWTFKTVFTVVIPPVIDATDPLNLATNVALNKVISATFDQAMDPLTITGTSFTLMTGTTPVTGTVSYTGLKATFTPTSDLQAGTEYTAKITTDAKNLAGDPIASDYTWKFNTVLPVVPPVVASTDPLNLATGIALNKVISATFDQAMDPATITGTSFTLMDRTTPVTGTVSYSGLKASFTPSSNLQAGTEYTAKITTDAKNLAGDPIASDYTWKFNTVLPVVPPVVASTDPLNLATGVALNKVISATFDQAMDPATITGTSFTLMDGTTSVTGTVSYSGLKASFTPSSNLQAGTEYTAKITTAAKNPAGVAIASDYTWKFNTVLPVVPPVVASTDPLDLATGVALNKVISATFDQAMDPATITGTSFTLMDGATSVTGTVSYSGLKATFTPSSNLSSGASYTATITTDAKNPAGVAIANDYIWKFNTVAHMGPMLIDLDCAAPFAILAGSTITNTGLTTINGDVGLFPGTALTGFPPGTINGVQQINTPIANAAKGCLTTAYNDGQGRSLNAISLPGQLGGLTLAPGLYSNSSSSGISGTGANGILTLDAQGDKNAVWIFQMSSTLTTDSGTSIVLAGDAQAKNIFWIVGTSATLGTTSVFYGNILADQAITLNTGAVLNGRALTRIAAVSLDASTINKP